jgi:hypothetical protein
MVMFSTVPEPNKLIQPQQDGLSPIDRWFRRIARFLVLFLVLAILLTAWYVSLSNQTLQRLFDHAPWLAKILFRLAGPPH